MCGRLEILHHSAIRMRTGLPLSKCTPCLASPGGVLHGHGLIGAVTLLFGLGRWGRAILPPENLPVKELYIWGRLRPFFLPQTCGLLIVSPWPDRLPPSP